MLDVVEREHRVEQHERRFVARVLLPFVARPRLQRRLEPRRRVVAEEADRASGEARQEAGHERRTVLSHDPAQGPDEGLVEGGRLSALLEDSLAVTGAQDEERVLAEEGVAGHLLPALHALEEERVIGVFRNAEERKDTGVRRSASSSRQTGTNVSRPARSTDSSKVVWVIADMRSPGRAPGEAPRRGWQRAARQSGV